MYEDIESQVARLKGTSTAKTLASLNGTPQATLGTLRNRYDLQLSGDTQGGWARFPLVDFVRVRLVRQFMDLKMSAAVACEIVNEISGELDDLAASYIDDAEKRGELTRSDEPYLIVRRKSLGDAVEVQIAKSVGTLIDVVAANATHPTIIVPLGATVRRVAALLIHRTRPIEEALDPNLSLEGRVETAWRDPEIRSEFDDNKARYTAYCRAFEAGRIRHE